MFAYVNIFVLRREESFSILVTKEQDFDLFASVSR